MKAYIINESNKTWQLENRPDPVPQAGEVLIKIKATSINFRDVLIARGQYRLSGKTSAIPLSDGAGEILALGEGVTEFKVGDRVAGNFFQNWVSGPNLPEYGESALGGAIDGMLAEKVVRQATGIVKIPEHLSYEEAATLPCAGVTAWNALMESSGPLKPGSTVLTLGTGGVSLFAMQFAKAAGLQVISTSSSDEKLAVVRAMGVDYGINYKTIPEWQNEVKKFTNGIGVDQVIEVGGDTMSRSIESLKLGGTISFIGMRAGMREPFNLLSILGKSARLQGIFVGSVAMFKAMNRAIEAHKIKPIIAEVFDFDQANQALEKFAMGEHFGKVVIRV